MARFAISGPVFRAFDANGLPLAGGKLYSYEAGTSTPLATYVSQDGVANTNPVILDASGEADVWIPEGVPYKFNLTDADDVQQAQYPVDNFSIPSATAVVPPSPVPTGGLIAFGGSSAPSGYLLCDGSEVSRATYAALFAVIGTTYGGGDGSTSFNVPDMRGKAIYGKATAGTGSTLGGSFGSMDHTHTGPSHTHQVTVPRDNWGSNSEAPHTVDGRLRVSNTGGSGPDATGYFATADQTVNSAAGGTGATGTGNPPGIACTWIIKT